MWKGDARKVFCPLLVFSLPFSNFFYAVLIVVFGALKQGMENEIR